MPHAAGTEKPVSLNVEGLMLSIEESVKKQFSKVFTETDWRLFKDVAEFNFAEAAHLKKKSFQISEKYKLLVRNIRKRLLIGIGVELLLKAVYLRSGHGINRPLDRKAGLKLPYRLSDVAQYQLDPNETFTLNQLIEQLRKVIDLPNSHATMEGLKIAKVFRNKEGHVVTASHQYDSSSYRAIEGALVEIYQVTFGKKLEVRFAFEAGEQSLWHVAL